MDSISTDVWKRRGSSIVFHQESLGPLIADDALISLRQVLGWIGSVPSVPPIAGRNNGASRGGRVSLHAHASTPR
jgi:hypothetical protein